MRMPDDNIAFVKGLNIMEEVIDKIFVDNEKLFRERAAKALSEKLKEADEPLKRKAVTIAQNNINEMAFYEIKEIYELLNYDFDDNEPSEEPIEFEEEPDLPKVFSNNKYMRSKILKAEYGDIISISDGKGHVFLFKLLMRLAHRGKYYCYMIRPKDENNEFISGTFFEYSVGEHALDDKLILVEDGFLIMELKELL